MARARARRNSRVRAAGAFALLGAIAPLACAQLAPEISPGIPGVFSRLGVPGVPVVPVAGAGQPSSVLPGVRSTLTLTDNAARGADGEKEAGYRLEVAPYVTANASNSRFQGTLSYSLRALYSSADNDYNSGLRHTLSARGNALLLGDWLGVQASADSFYASTSAFGTLSTDPTVSQLNSTRVTTVSVVPYIQGRMGTFANYRAQYSLTRTDTTGQASNLLGQSNEQLLGSVSSGPQFNRWGWSLVSSGTRREYAGGLQLGSTTTIASLYYVFSPELRLGVSANYLSIDRLTNTRGETSGWGPGFSVDWSPGRRTSLRLNVAEEYYGTSGSLAFAHRTARWTFGVNYNRAVYSSNNAGILTMGLGDLLSAGAYAPTLNPIFQQLIAQGVISPNDILVNTGIINDALVRSNNAMASIGYLLPRGSLTLSGYRTVRETLLDSTLFVPAGDPILASSFGRFENRGVALGLSMPLDGRTTASISGSVGETKSLETSDKARFTTLAATVSSRVDAKTTVSAGVRRTEQNGSGIGIAGYDENLVFGTLDVRF